MKSKIIQLVAWDMEDTLIPKAQIESEKGTRIIRANALELLSSDRDRYIINERIELNPGVREVLNATSHNYIQNGIISGFAYQPGLNLIIGARLSNYINPRLIELAHKHAWEEMVLAGKDYDQALDEWKKPSIKMFQELIRKFRENYGEISPEQCLYFGDNERDQSTACEAGWKYMDIKEVAEFKNKEDREVYENLIVHMLKK